MPGKKREKPAKKRTIIRKIFFYRVNAGVHYDTGKPRVINFGPTVRHIETLPFTDEGRYLNGLDNKQLCCWPDTSQPPYRIRLANIRRGQYPLLKTRANFRL